MTTSGVHPSVVVLDPDRLPADLTAGSPTAPLPVELLDRVDRYWRAANYLSVGQLYLYDNPLLKRPLELSDVKPLVVGHWGTTPGQNFIYVHLNRVITARRGRSRRRLTCVSRTSSTASTSSAT